MVRIFGHYIPRSLLVLVAVEVAALFLAFYFGVWARFSSDGSAKSIEDLQPLFPKAVIFVAVTIGAMTLMGLYSRHFREALLEMIVKVAIAFALSVIGLMMMFYLFPDLFVGRGALAIVLAIGFSYITLIRMAFLRLVDLKGMKRRILVLGAGNRASVVNRLLRRKADRRGIAIAGYIRLAHEHALIDSELIEHNRPLMDLARDYRAQGIVVAVDDRRNNFPLQEIVNCRMSGIEVLDLPTFIERQCGKVLLENLQPSWLIYSEGFTHGALRGFEKRAFDLVVSILLLLVIWPIMLITALAILIESGGRGPIFYRQTRVGEHGEPFDVLKFRSMTVDAEAEGAPQWASKNDPRVTRVGAFIRNFRIDELPQLFNVIRGDMSFVGPRPERPEFVADLSKKILYYAERHYVKPGITGWAQISYPYGSSEKDAKEKLQYDLYYVKNYSLFLDLLIIFQTAQAVLWKRGGR